MPWVSIGNHAPNRFCYIYHTISNATDPNAQWWANWSFLHNTGSSCETSSSCPRPTCGSLPIQLTIWLKCHYFATAPHAIDSQYGRTCSTVGTIRPCSLTKQSLGTEIKWRSQYPAEIQNHFHGGPNALLLGSRINDQGHKLVQTDQCDPIHAPQAAVSQKKVRCSRLRWADERSSEYLKYRMWLAADAVDWMIFIYFALLEIHAQIVLCLIANRMTMHG